MKLNNINVFDNRIRVLSFQSKDVLCILLEQGIYHPRVSMSRELRDYKKEKEVYGFKDVIWCFSPINCKTIIKDKFTKEDFIDGAKFSSFKCEMSLRTMDCFNDMLLFELEYDKSELKPGLTHNACSYVCVAPQLSIENLKAVYRLNYDRKRKDGWYFPEVFVEQLFSNDTIFKNNFICEDYD